MKIELHLVNAPVDVQVNIDPQTGNIVIGQPVAVQQQNQNNLITTNQTAPQGQTQTAANLTTAGVNPLTQVKPSLANKKSKKTTQQLAQQQTLKKQQLSTSRKTRSTNAKNQSTVTAGTTTGQTLQVQPVKTVKPKPNSKKQTTTSKPNTSPKNTGTGNVQKGNIKPKGMPPTI